MLVLLIHLFMLRQFVAMSDKIFLVIFNDMFFKECFSRNLMGTLPGVIILVNFWLTLDVHTDHYSYGHFLKQIRHILCTPVTMRVTMRQTSYSTMYPLKPVLYDNMSYMTTTCSLK